MVGQSAVAAPCVRVIGRNRAAGAAWLQFSPTQEVSTMNEGFCVSYARREPLPQEVAKADLQP